MSASEDIKNLFRQFGGQPQEYQEIVRSNEAQNSQARWPLLSSVKMDQNAPASVVRSPVGDNTSSPSAAAPPPLPKPGPKASSVETAPTQPLMAFKTISRQPEPSVAPTLPVFPKMIQEPLPHPVVTPIAEVAATTAASSASPLSRLVAEPTVTPTAPATPADPPAPRDLRAIFAKIAQQEPQASNTPASRNDSLLNRLRRL